MPKVSIVVPVYNMEKYLDRCVKSIQAQTLQDIEIILVDDGGKDRSVQMCDEYAAADSRIKVLHKPNGGLTSAWKAGSRIATGEYTGYIDSDDFIEREMYERLYERAVQENADIACCGLKHFYEAKDHEEWTEQMEFPQDVFSVEQLRDKMFPVLINNGSFMGRSLQPNRVTKLVRTSLVQKNLSLCDDRVDVGEDFQFSLCMFLDADKVVILKDYFPYYYWMNNTSMTMKYDEHYIERIKRLKENLERISDQKNVFDFKPQITNDFLCLTVLEVKGSIYKRKGTAYRILRKDLVKICTDDVVVKALKEADMPGLSAAEKLFLFFMKYHFYFLIYLAVRVYFR
ncbi:MAG: glycosyltransferase [Lachnospiraceae bacterium]|jgi:glycosyltransferase involved in cell wall biosynthesis|nr:glycosyltransferase [Lachnospiraceae bacterium]